MTTTLLQPSAKVTLPCNCTFEENDWRILARYWYPVALMREVEEKGLVGTMLLDEALVVYKADDEIVVASDICTHRGVPLSMGSNADCKGVRCPYHGLQFGADGKCIDVPAHPAGAIPKKLNLKTYPALLRYGFVWTCLSQDPEFPATPAPTMLHWDDPGFRQIAVPPFDIGAFAGRQIEGFLDVAHFAFVHTGTFADPDKPEVPAYEVTRTDEGFEAHCWSDVSDYNKKLGKFVPKDFLWLRHFRAMLPFTANLTIHYPDDGRLSILNAASPVSARKTKLFCAVARNFDMEQPLEDIYDFHLRVFAEDSAMVENQKPENLPLDLTMEAHILADRSSIAYRRGLRDLGLSQFFLV